MTKMGTDKPKTTTIQKILLIFLGLFLGLILLEFGLRLGGFVLTSFQEQANQVSLKESGEYVILCLGESTTACGGENSYPRQLEKVLNNYNTGIAFTVINKGIIGTNTAVILSQLEHNLKVYNPQIVITMMGINDRVRTRVFGNEGDKEQIHYFERLRIHKLAKYLWDCVSYQVNNHRDLSGAVNLEPSHSGREGDEDLFKPIKPQFESVPIASNAYLKSGDRYLKQRLYEKAEEKYKQAIAFSSAELSRYLLEVSNNPWKYLGNIEEVIVRILAINTITIRAHRQLGKSYLYRKMWAAVIPVAENLIKISQGKDRLYLSLADLYNSRKQTEAAVKMYQRASEFTFYNDRYFNVLALCYLKLGKHKRADEYFNKAYALRSQRTAKATVENYRKLREVLAVQGIKLICVQYPMRAVQELKDIFKETIGITFVDNEKIFKDAVKRSSYQDYFWDYFAGDFGHCTPNGNRLLSENIGRVLMREVFGVDLKNGIIKKSPQAEIAVRN